MFFLWFIIILSTVFFLDWIFSLSFVPFYFRSGIPFVQKSYGMPTPRKKDKLIDRLNQAFPDSGCMRGVVFSQISENEIAFRGKFSFIRKEHFPNGLIQFIPEKERVIVKTYLNFWIVMIAFMFHLPFILVVKHLILTPPERWPVFEAGFAVVVIIPLLILYSFYLSHVEQIKFAKTVAELINISA